MKKLLFIPIILLMSCIGAKTLNKSENKIDSTANKTETAKVVSSEKQTETKVSDSSANSSTTTKINSIGDAFHFEPIDPTKESSIIDKNGNVTKFKNAKGSFEKKQQVIYIVDTSSIHKLKASQSEIERLKHILFKKNEEISLSKMTKAKVVHRDSFNLFSTWWFWIILIIIAIILYLAYKYYSTGTKPLSLITGLWKRTQQ